MPAAIDRTWRTGSLGAGGAWAPRQDCSKLRLSPPIPTSPLTPALRSRSAPEPTCHSLDDVPRNGDAVAWGCACKGHARLRAGGKCGSAENTLLSLSRAWAGEEPELQRCPILVQGTDFLQIQSGIPKTKTP